MARLNIERQKELEPLRIDYARQELKKLGIKIAFQNDTRIEFYHRGSVVKLYPYSGWHCGKSIKDGRGINKLLKQLREKQG